MIQQPIATWAARLSAAFFAVFALLQVALAAGVSLGGIAWGGASATPSASLRIASGVAAMVLMLAASVMLIRAGDIGRTLPAKPAWWLNLIFGLLLVLNTAANLASPSTLERLVMGPAAGLGACLCLLALARR